MPIQSWTTKSSKYILKDRYMTLRADTCETARGETLNPIYVQELRDWVHVVAFDSNDRILIVRQYRHGASKICTEVPCGCIDEGETPLEAIQRELLEETGCIADEWEQLPVTHANTSFCSNRIYPFIALNTRCIQEQKFEKGEDIEFAFLPIDEVLQIMDQGDLNLATIYLALKRRGFIKVKGL